MQIYQAPIYINLSDNWKTRKKGQERGIVNGMMSEYFLEKTNWQLNTSSQEGSELMNSAWSRACPLFLWAQKPNWPESQKLIHINQAEPNDSCIKRIRHITNNI